MNNGVIKFKRYIAISPLAVCCWLTVLSSTSVLADDVSQYTARKLVSSGQILPLEEIHEKAQLIKPGKIIETELENKKGKYIYEIELVDDTGLVWELKFDANTGNLIKLEQD